MAVKILGTGSYLPPNIVTNEDLAKTLDTSDEWIFSHSGIHSRHITGSGEGTATMAVEASRAALAAAGVAASEIDIIVLTTCSSDYLLPSSACLVQAALGCTKAFAYDLAGACSGFVYGLEMARGYLSLHHDAKALVVGSETLSRIIDWKDRGSCILFGDGAGAAVLGWSEDGPSDVCHAYLRSDGAGYDVLVREGGTRVAPSGDPQPAPVLKMAGKAVFQFAIKVVPQIVEELCKSAGMSTSDIDLFIPHQANIRIIDSAAKRLGIKKEQVFTNIETVANTSSASIPVAIDEALRSGRLKDGMSVCFVGFGAGLTSGGILTRWPYL